MKICKPVLINYPVLKILITVLTGRKRIERGRQTKRQERMKRRNINIRQIKEIMKTMVMRGVGVVITAVIGEEIVEIIVMKGVAIQACQETKAIIRKEVNCDCTCML